MDDAYLAHHGILGMKWGVRRYQNEDGSYTNAGIKRHTEQQENLQKQVASRSGFAKDFRNDAREYASKGRFIKSHFANKTARRFERGAKKSQKQLDKLNRTPEEIAQDRKRNIKRGAIIATGVLATGILAYGAYKTGAYKKGMDAASKIFEQSSKAASNAADVAATNVKKKANKAIKAASSAVEDTATKAASSAKKKVKKAVTDTIEDPVKTATVERTVTNHVEARMRAKAAAKQAAKEKTDRMSQDLRDVGKAYVEQGGNFRERRKRAKQVRKAQRNLKRNLKRNARAVDNFNNANDDFINNLNNMMGQNGMRY